MPRTNPFGRLVIRLMGEGNFDHPDLAEIDKMGHTMGLSQHESRQAFFVARDKNTLVESELIDGGTGNAAKKVKDKQILTATFSNGESKA